MAIEVSSEAPFQGFRATATYRGYVLAILMLVGAFAWVDRQVFSIVLQSIKTEFVLSDTQLGLIGGTAFGLFYVATGLPVAWLADRFSRRDIIAASVGIWSVMTAACATASGFPSLFLTRMGVGIGEAGAAAPSQSMLSDYFSADRRGMALGLMYSYVPIGYLVSYSMGGWLNDAFGWRMAFITFGLPGIALAILVRTTVREPPRGYSDLDGSAGINSAPAFLQTLKHFLKRPSLRHLPLGGAIHAIGMVGASVWMPAYFIRVHGMTSTAIGLRLSVILGLAGLIGTLTGGHIADRVVRRTGDPRWYAWICGLALVGTVPFTLGVYLSSDPGIALLLFIVPTIFNHLVLGPVMASIQNLVGAGRRAMAAAFYLFGVNLIATGLGPLVIGALSDFLKADLGNDGLRYALAGLISGTSLWAAVHFALAARTLRADMKRAAAAD